LLGGNHRWSWFASDLDSAGEALVAGFRQTEWNDGYDVHFPGRTRTLATPYRSLASADFAAGLARALPAASITTSRAAAALDAQGVTLGDGTRIGARAVIDCRGLAGSAVLTGGWQVFMGRHLRTGRPHGVTRPVVMDAGVEQHGAYRFVYVLPLGIHDLFVEDTYYADSPVLDRRTIGARLEAYCAAHGWTGEVVGNETGVLPVVTGGDFAAFQTAQRTPGVAVAGVRGGFFHPLTSYSLPQAVATALAVADHADANGEDLAALLEARARAHWRKTGFYRMLGTMLFGAEPEARWHLFARFYGLSAPLIGRFYAGSSTLADKARVLLGRPPMPIPRALAALARGGAPLAVAA
jgi:lycopene beta-cyclase